MKTSVALIGFMGTGKTAVGKALAKHIGRDFIELDAMIEKNAGRSITDIFRQDGEDYCQVDFKALENRQWVQIWAAGPIAESFPMQGTAAQVLITANP